MELKGKWVVITRPLHQGKNLQVMLEAVDAHALLFPLIEISPLENTSLLKERLNNLTTYDLLIFVSANAVKQTVQHLGLLQFKSLISSCKVATTGSKTALILEKNDITIDFCPNTIFNSEALLALPRFKTFCTGRRIAIIRGEGGRDFLRDELKRFGAIVDYINVYKRNCPQDSLMELKKQYEQGKLDTILFTSGTSINHFFNLVKGDNWVDGLTLLIGSSRMQKEIPESFQGKLVIAEDPSDETLYKKLTEIYK